MTLVNYIHHFVVFILHSGYTDDVNLYSQSFNLLKEIYGGSKLERSW
jgi:hypothetical protein